MLTNDSIIFPHNSWKKLIARVCKKIDYNNLGLEIITPFGFELLEDKSFNYKKIKRLYCYIGIPKVDSTMYSLEKLSCMFLDELLNSLHEIDMKKSDIAIVALQDKIHLLHTENYRCNETDRLLDIQTRFVASDILSDYSDYIITTIDSFCSSKDEPKFYFENKRYRNRAYQLYILLESLFGYLLPCMSVIQMKRFRSICERVDNSIQMFYTTSDLYVHASDEEMNLFNSLILPRVASMFDIIRSGDQSELINLQCDAYHVDDKLELKINTKVYARALNKVKRTYLNFASL